MNIHRRFFHWAIWRMRWALWQRLQYVWIALMFILLLDRLQHAPVEVASVTGLWLAARIIRKFRP